MENTWVRLSWCICWGEWGATQHTQALPGATREPSRWRCCPVSYLPGSQLCVLVVTQSLSLSGDNYAAYPGKTLIFTWKPRNCTLLHIMYTKPEINKWCYSASQAVLHCLHCVCVHPYGVCAVGGLHFPQHTVISLSSVAHHGSSQLKCTESCVSKCRVQTKEDTGSRKERTGIHGLRIRVF